MEVNEVRHLLQQIPISGEMEPVTISRLLEMEDGELESFWGYAWNRCRTLSERNKTTGNSHGEITSPARWIVKCFPKFLYLDWQTWHKLQEEMQQKREEQVLAWNKKKEAKQSAKQKAQAEKYQPLSPSELRRVAAEVNKKVGE